MNSTKRFLAALLIAVMMLSLIPTTLAESTLKAKTTGSVHMREYAGTNYDTILTIPKGKNTTFMEDAALDNRDIVWVKVKYDGQVGWVSTTYIEVENYLKYVVADGGDSKIHKYADIDSDYFDTLTYNKCALYLGKSTEDDRGVIWYNIRYGGKTGWISSKYTSIKDATPEKPQPKPGPSGKQKYVVCKDGAQSKVRKRPSVSSTALGTLHAEDEGLKYLGDTQYDERGVKWYKVQFKKQNAWISSAYTKLTEKKGGGGSSKPSRPYVKTTGNVRMRKSYDLDAKSIITLPKGVYAKYLKEGAYDDRGVMWYKVKYNGKTGWVSEKYVDLYD